MAKAKPAGKHQTIHIGWYEDLMEISPVGIFFTDAEGNCLHVNRTWCEIAGMSPEQALGRGWLGAIHADDVEQVEKLWYEAAKNNRPFHAEYRFRTPRGKSTWVTGQAHAKLDEGGAIEGYIGTITDISKTKLAQDKLQQSSKRIRSILNHMPVLLFAFDQSGLLCAWNHEAHRITGFTAREIIGNPDAMKWLCPDPHYRREMLDTYKKRGNDYRDWDWRLTAKDGTVKIISFSNISKYYPIDGWESWGVGFDVTYCRQTEWQLRERVKELGCLYKLSLLSNQPGLKMEKYFQEAVELLPESWQYPDITCARIIYEGNMFKTEDFAVTRWQLASQIDVRNRKSGLIEVYYKEERPQEAEGPFMIEERLLLDEIALQISRTVGHILAKEDLALLDDISSKAEQLEHFSHTISHDLKTPLTAIGGFAEFLGKQLDQGKLDQAVDCTERIVENIRRMERRLDEILRLAKIGRVIEPTEEVDLKKIIDDTVAMMAKQLKEASVEIEVKEQFPRVVGDSMRLREVIENLLGNAICYIGKQPNRITIGCHDRGTETVFYIKDTGIGIDPQHFDSIFELFWRHDKKTDGHGVGLAIARRIIEAHGGRLWVESEGEGTGSCFCFTLGKVLD
ncbi:MAG: PAS domain-containing sensor histidine kinase [Desulfuromonadales bacterium]|jgi:PAS domain S-box-containing protein